MRASSRAEYQELWANRRRRPAADRPRRAKAAESGRSRTIRISSTGQPTCRTQHPGTIRPTRAAARSTAAAPGRPTPSRMRRRLGVVGPTDTRQRHRPRQPPPMPTPRRPVWVASEPDGPWGARPPAPAAASRGARIERRARQPGRSRPARPPPVPAPSGGADRARTVLRDRTGRARAEDTSPHEDPGRARGTDGPGDFASSSRGRCNC